MLVEKLSQKRNGKPFDGFVLKNWINSTYDSLFVIRMEQVVTMTELDKRIEMFYLNNINDTTEESYDSDEDSNKVKPNNFSKQMGYLGSVKETKKFLEEIYKKS